MEKKRHTLGALAALCLLALLPVVAGCSRCSGRLAPEAERAIESGRYSMDEWGGRVRRPDAPTPSAYGMEPDTAAAGRAAGHAHGGTAPAHLADGQLELPAPLADRPEQILRRKAYVASFNNKTLMPNWVAWRLDRAETYGKVKRKGVKFEEDPEVEPRYRVTTYDYNQSGFDRGHLCPAGDNKWDAQAMQECFLMTNMCPQLHGLNSGDWNDLEMQCRTWARAYGELYIVCGPLVDQTPARKIGRQRRITVPSGFFKVVLTMQDGPRALGFVFGHDSTKRPLGDYVCTVDEVEQLTGIDFFASLPDDVERAVEARADWSRW